MLFFPHTHTPIAPFLLKNAEFGYMRYEKPRATRQKTVGGGGGGGDWEERTLGLFVKSFLPAFREKQHRNIFSHHTGRLAKCGWILTYLKISVEMAVTWFLPGAIQLHSTLSMPTLLKVDRPFWWSSMTSNARFSVHAKYIVTHFFISKVHTDVWSQRHIFF